MGVTKVDEDTRTVQHSCKSISSLTLILVLFLVVDICKGRERVCNCYNLYCWIGKYCDITMINLPFLICNPNCILHHSVLITVYPSQVVQEVMLLAQQCYAEVIDTLSFPYNLYCWQKF